jgi:hypothetical protein
MMAVVTEFSEEEIAFIVSIWKVLGRCIEINFEKQQIFPEEMVGWEFQETSTSWDNIGIWDTSLGCLELTKESSLLKVVWDQVMRV